MNLEASILDLSRQLADQLADQTRQLLAEAQAEIQQLQAALQEQTRLRQQAEESVQGLQQQNADLNHSLERERRGRCAAEQQLQAIETAILAQLEVAEAEQEREAAIEAERERQWGEQLEAQRAAWLQERAQRELLEQRIVRFRSAASELLALELGTAPVAPLPQRIEGLSLACSS